MRAPTDARVRASGLLSRLAQLPEQWLFGPHSEGARRAARVRRALRYPYAVWRDLAGGALSLRAMGLVYETLLAIVPLLAFSFGILRAFNAQSTLQPLVHQFFAPMGPSGEDLTAQIMGYANRVRGGLVGSVGLALLIWTLIGTMKKVEDGFNFIWHVNVPRNLARRLTEYVALLVIGPILLAAVIGLSRLAEASVPLRLLSQLALMDRIDTVALGVAPYVIVSALLAVLYKVIPNTRVQMRAALIGGLVAGILWAAIGRGFTLFVLSSTRLTAVYAGLAILIAALIWVYLNWVILLLGAQVAFYAQNPVYLRVGLGELRLSCDDTERLALGILYCVGSCYRDGGARPSVSQLAAQLGYPGSAVARLCVALEDAGLLAMTDEDTLLPARELSRLSVNEVLQTARAWNYGLIRAEELTPAPVAALHARFERGWREHCAGMTLADLLDASSAPGSLPGDGHTVDQQ